MVTLIAVLLIGAFGYNYDLGCYEAHDPADYEQFMSDYVDHIRVVYLYDIDKFQTTKQLSTFMRAAEKLIGSQPEIMMVRYNLGAQPGNAVVKENFQFSGHPSVYLYRAREDDYEDFKAWETQETIVSMLRRMNRAPTDYYSTEEFEEALVSTYVLDPVVLGVFTSTDVPQYEIFKRFVVANQENFRFAFLETDTAPLIEKYGLQNDNALCVFKSQFLSDKEDVPTRCIYSFDDFEFMKRFIRNYQQPFIGKFDDSTMDYFTSRGKPAVVMVLDLSPEKLKGLKYKVNRMRKALEDQWRYADDMKKNYAWYFAVADKAEMEQLTTKLECDHMDTFIMMLKTKNVDQLDDSTLNINIASGQWVQAYVMREWEFLRPDGVFDQRNMDKWIYSAFKDINSIEPWYRTEDKPKNRIDEHGVFHFTRANLKDDVFRKAPVGDTLILFYQGDNPLAAQQLDFLKKISLKFNNQREKLWVGSYNVNKNAVHPLFDFVGPVQWNLYWGGVAMSSPKYYGGPLEFRDIVDWLILENSQGLKLDFF